MEEFFRETNKRYDYPSCAPHATQAWGDPAYRRWWDALSSFDSNELASLRERVSQYVLATLPDQAFDPSSILREPPLFQRIITSFDLSSRTGETTGAAYQGLVFGFLRADNPHLQVEIDRVRTGGKRRDRVGDIDAWDGGRLAVTAEVKQYTLGPDNVAGFGNFANSAARHGAIGIVASLAFHDGVREAIRDLGLFTMDIDDILSIVELWDPAKQRIAVSSMNYYFKHIERNSALTNRLDEFLLEAMDDPEKAG